LAATALFTPPREQCRSFLGSHRALPWVYSGLVPSKDNIAASWLALVRWARTGAAAMPLPLFDSRQANRAARAVPLSPALCVPAHGARCQLPHEAGVGLLSETIIFVALLTALAALLTALVELSSIPIDVLSKHIKFTAALLAIEADAIAARPLLQLAPLAIVTAATIASLLVSITLACLWRIFHAGVGYDTPPSHLMYCFVLRPS
jgi:hypothetical protein